MTHALAGGPALKPRGMRRLMQELVTLKRSLPLGRREGALLRFDEGRADLLKLVVMGSAGTPYASGCFEFHLRCPEEYPEKPPTVRLVTTGGGSVRFNPNLYEDGLVCSSLLNQGSGWGSVTWRPGDSNLLEVAQGLMWVHMNADVLFAEPSLETLKGTKEGDAANEAYCDIVRWATVRYAMVEQLRRPPEGFEKAIRDHFRLCRDEILDMVETWLEIAHCEFLDLPDSIRRAAEASCGLADQEGALSEAHHVHSQGFSGQEDQSMAVVPPATPISLPTALGDPDVTTTDPNNMTDAESDAEPGSGVMDDEAAAPDDIGSSGCAWMPAGPQDGSDASLKQVSFESHFHVVESIAASIVHQTENTPVAGVAAIGVVRRRVGHAPRNPKPNYNHRFVQSHNPALAGRFHQGYYYLDLKKAFEMLQTEMGKL